MARTPAEIVHTLNELIAESETNLQALDMADHTVNVADLATVLNHHRRAIGQLKAARTSLLATRSIILEVKK